MGMLSISSLYMMGAKRVALLQYLRIVMGNHNIGIRWNVSEKEWDDRRKYEDGMVCVGMPQSRGYSVWFILPDTSWKFS